MEGERGWRKGRDGERMKEIERKGVEKREEERKAERYKEREGERGWRKENRENDPDGMENHGENMMGKYSR